jgi:hypothetical protein
MTKITVGDVGLFVDVVGRGHPLVLMHGGLGADHWTLLRFRQQSDAFTLSAPDTTCRRHLKTDQSAAVPTTDQFSRAVDTTRMTSGLPKS